MSAGIFRKTRLSNGVRVVTEFHSKARAVSVGLWVTRGTRDEKTRLSGISHFLEHLVFKGTKKRTAFEISRDMDAVGGDLNAFTSREYTCFQALSLREHLDLSIDVVSDLVSNAKISKSDFLTEKNVILQEILMSQDMLEEYIFDLFFEKAYKGTCLGIPILGTQKSIEAMTRQDVWDYYQQMYVPENLIMAVTGQVDHDEVIRLTEKYLDPHASPGKVRNANAKKDPRLGAMPSASKPVKSYRQFSDLEKRTSEQVNILTCLPAASFQDKLRFDAYVVNSLLGGGMTSRLYQSIREERGLVYSIYSQLSSHVDCGMQMIYAATDAAKTEQVMSLIEKEVKRLRRDGVSKKQVDFYKTQVTGQILLGSDDLENRMNSIAINEMIFGSYRAVDDVMRDIQNISVESVNEYVEKYIQPDKMSLLLLGPYEKKVKKDANRKSKS